MHHLIESVKKSLRDKNYLPALYLSITLPDICARIESDNNKTSEKKYIKWFDKYLAKTYKCEIGADKKEHTFLTGGDLYALRCSLLHEGRLNIETQRAKEVHEKFMFTIGHPHLRQINSILQLDLPTFCEEICTGVSIWLKENIKNPNIQRKLKELISIFEGDYFIVP